MKIGITERGDASIEPWQKQIKNVDMAILITKNIDNTLFQTNALEFKDKVIVHATITGFGGTFLEPNISKWGKTIEALANFTENFPSKQIVLRIDPIIPTEKGLSKVYDILKSIPEGIERVRFSFINNYKHIQERGLKLPWTTFLPPMQLQRNAVALFTSFEKKVQIESCGEDTIAIPERWKIGCVSKLDCNILGLTPPDSGYCTQRKSCKCLDVKTELLTRQNYCPNGCIYCYWQWASNERRQNHE